MSRLATTISSLFKSIYTEDDEALFCPQNIKVEANDKNLYPLKTEKTQDLSRAFSVEATRFKTKGREMSSSALSVFTYYIPDSAQAIHLPYYSTEYPVAE